MKSFRALGLLTGFLILSYPAKCQMFKGGILFGINACQVDGDALSGYNKLGFMAGAYVTTPINSSLDLQLEIEYTGKGAQSVVTQNNPVQYTDRLNYIELPVLIRYKKVKKFGFSGGLGFGYLFSSVGILSTKDPTAQINFKPFELSGIIGMDYLINNNLHAVIRYSYSILSIANTYTNLNAKLYLTASGLYNNLFSLGISYQIGKD